MKTLRNLILILLILLLLFLIFRSPKPIGVKSPSIAPSAPPISLQKADDRHRLVDALLKKNRAAIGVCLQKSNRPRTSQVQLLMTWKPVGLIETVRLVPDLGESSRRCLEDLIRPWKLPAAEDLAPLTVSKRLSLDAH